jgi:hypothetical protein
MHEDLKPMAAKKSLQRKSTQQTQPSEQLNDIITMDRRRQERRTGTSEPMESSGSPSPRKQQRRRHIDPTTCERDYNDQEIEFMRAMDDYKRQAGRMFPTCSEVLEVIRSLGYFQLNDAQIEALGLDTFAEPSTLADCTLEDSDAEFAEV